MILLLLILAAAATVVCFVRFKKKQGVIPLILSSIALIGLLIASFSVGTGKPKGSSTAIEMVMEGESVIAEIMGKQAAKLVPGGGRALVFTSSEAVEVRSFRIRREAELRGLKRGLAKNFTLTVFEPSPPQQPYFTMLGAEDLRTALRAYPDTKVILLFLMVTGPLPDLAGAGGVGPKVIASSMPEGLMRQELRAGHIHAAVVPRKGVKMDFAHVPKGDAQQIFDAQYQLLTPENL